MNDNEFINFTVDITDEVPPPRSGSFGEMPKRLPLGARLLALWSGLFGLAVGVPVVLLMALLGDDFGAGAVVICAPIFACVHTAASAKAFKRYKRKYDIFAWQFVFLCALPMLALGAVAFITSTAFSGWDGIFFVIIALCYGGYSVVYGVLLFVVLGIMHALGKKRISPARSKNFQRQEARIVPRRSLRGFPCPRRKNEKTTNLPRRRRGRFPNSKRVSPPEARGLPN